MTRTRQVRLVLIASLGLLPWLVLPAAAQSIRVGQTQNAIGMLVVVRSDGIEERLQGKGPVPIFEGDVLRTESSSQALIEFRDGIQLAISENTSLKILSRWEQAKGITPILRLKRGEIWVKTGQGPKPLEVETPVAVAAVQGTEFNMKVLEDGQSVLTVIEGNVQFGTAFGTCPIPRSTVSYGVRGKRCTKPVPADVKAASAWTQALLK